MLRFFFIKSIPQPKKFMSAKTQKICCCFLVDMLWHLEVSLTLRYAKLCCIVKTDPPIWLTFAILPIFVATDIFFCVPLTTNGKLNRQTETQMFVIAERKLTITNVYRRLLRR